MALSASALRMFSDALMPVAWFVLPSHLLYGLTFSAIHMAGVSYANQAAPRHGGNHARTAEWG
ncbi:MAG: MFS transporter [Caldilineaceae bacterium]|nr:MFS transporter [Caldilineaceae bacterium]